MRHFCPIARKTAYLLLPSANDRPSRNHLARFIIEASVPAATGPLNQSALAEVNQWLK